MEIKLTSTAKAELEHQHKKERDRRIADRIKAVLLAHEGWTQKQIAQALRIGYDTVHDYLKDYTEKNKLKHESGGSQSKLNEEQTKQLEEHLEKNTYIKVSQICQYVKEKFQVVFTVPGMTHWLKAHHFSYKKPKGTPSKADPEKQKKFIEMYEKLKKETPVEEPILFGDAVHPTMATKVTEGWIRKGKDKPIETTASRTRLNLMGSLNLATMDLVITKADTINSETLEKHLEQLKNQYSTAPKIHLILDQGPYNISEITKKAAQKYGIQLYYLSAYSPNLNPIERVWKVMNENVRNNRFFPSASEFRTSIMDFFEKTWPMISSQMIDRINDNFRIVQKEGF